MSRPLIPNSPAGPPPLGVAPFSPPVRRRVAEVQKSGPVSLLALVNRALWQPGISAVPVISALLH